MKKTLLFLVAFLTMISCTKESEPEQNTPTPGVVLVKKMFANDLAWETLYQFYYNGTKLTKITFYSKHLSIGTEYYTCQYEGDFITSIKRYNPENENTAIINFNYDSQGRLSQVSETDTNQNTYDYIYTYKEDGSVEMKTSGGTEIYYFEEGEIGRIDSSLYTESTFTCRYDNANSPFKNITGLDKIKLYPLAFNFMLGSNKNLIDMSIMYSSNKQVDNIHFDATYNSDNYPESLLCPTIGPFMYQFEYY